MVSCIAYTKAVKRVCGSSVMAGSKCARAESCAKCMVALMAPTTGFSELAR